MTATHSCSATRWLLPVLLIAQLVVILDITAVNIALPSLSRDLGISGSQISRTVTSYTLIFGSLLLLGGRAADMLGRRRLFLTGLGVFTVSSLASALAGTAAMLFAARARSAGDIHRWPAVDGCGGGRRHRLGADPVEAQTIAHRFRGYGFERAEQADTSDVIVSVPPRPDVVGLTSPEYDGVELEVLQDWLGYWERVAAGTEEPTPWSGETIEMAPGEIEKLAGEISARQASVEREPRTAAVPHTSPVAAVSTQHVATATASAQGMSSATKALLILGVVVLGAIGLWALIPGGSDTPSDHLGQATVNPSDAPSFQDDGYVPVKPRKRFPDGDYFVGVDMPVGRYVATGGSTCHWERRDEVANLLGSGVSTGGRVRVTVRDGEWFSTHQCGIWTRSHG